MRKPRGLQTYQRESEGNGLQMSQPKAPSPHPSARGTRLLESTWKGCRRQVAAGTFCS